MYIYAICCIERVLPSGTRVLFTPNLNESFYVPGIKHRYRIDFDSDIDTKHQLQRLPYLQQQENGMKTRRLRVKAGKRRARLCTREHTTYTRVVFGTRKKYEGRDREGEGGVIKTTYNKCVNGVV